MREIIFRGKSADNGEWLFGVPIFDWYYGGKTANIINVGLTECCDENMVIPETVGQFTGLTDKNGKKIFEGDIVNVNGNIGYIEWDAVHARWGRKIKLTCKDGKRRYVIQGIGVQTKMEIIGNIHDNHELLS